MSNGQYRQCAETSQSPPGTDTELSPRRSRLYYLASGSIAVPALAALFACTGLSLVGVGTQPDRPQGRKRRLQPTPVGEWCATHDVPCDKPEDVNDPSFLERLAALHVDVIVVFSFGQILSKALLAVPRLDCMNIHASLLPRYRGASPINAVILAGERETGISYMRMVRRLDAGPVFCQYTLALNGRETTPQLETRLADLAAETVCETVSSLCEGQLTAREQDHDLATYAGKIRKEDGWIDWAEPAVQIDRMVRAYAPWPGARTQIETPRGPRRLTLTETAVEPSPKQVDVTPGTVLQADKHALVIACGRAALNVRKLIPEGSREMTGSDYLRGTPLQEGSVLRYETAHC